MNPRLPWLPTFAQFLVEARNAGCTEKVVRGRLVLENPKLGLPVVVKSMQPNETLTQFYCEYLCRMLGVTTFGLDLPSSGGREPSEEEQT